MAIDLVALKDCPLVGDPVTGDLTWLMHRAVRVLTESFDAACRTNGLRDMRDVLVLGMAGDPHARTQIEIAGSLGLDKSTLMGIIDRLEGGGLLVREADPTNRRIRIPRTTKVGRAVLERTMAERDRKVAAVLSGFEEDEVRQLRAFLWDIATSGEPAEAPQASEAINV